MQRLILIVTIFFLTVEARSQQNVSILEYIKTYRQLAVDEMIRTGVPASIKLAQGIHETEAGQSDLVNRSNNHFGIKCKTGWQGDKVYHDDDERGECFRSYATPQESYSDHSNFLRKNQRYAFLFELDPTDYKSWAYGLKKAGYATNIKYSQILIKLIEEYDLQQYSLIALGKQTPPVDMVVSNTTPGGTAGPAAPIMEVAEIVPEPAREYPSGEFLINNTKVILAPAGTVLLSIAQKYDIPLSRLYEFNELNTDEVLLHSQLIFLQRKRKKGNTEYHTVTPGESLYDISQIEGIRLESLLEFNFLKPGDRPKPGTILYLQENATAAPELIQSSPDNRSTTAVEELPVKTIKLSHFVAAKETLYSISRRYAVTVDELKEWNHLRSSELRAGQKLIIYKK